MIFNIKVGNMSPRRKEIIEWVRKQKAENDSFTVLDVGGTMGGWTHEIVDGIVDINPVESGLYFKVNLNRYQDWESVRQYVNEHGKFSFAICSHTLEDIANPMLVLETLPEIAESGFIAVPSKYRELGHIESHQYRGYIHHRWIFNIRPEEPNLLVGFPKLSFIEQYFPLHKLGNASDEVAELSFYWKDNIPYRIINDDYLGPNTDAVKKYYLSLL
jgi:hypothetical protein